VNYTPNTGIITETEDMFVCYFCWYVRCVHA